MTEPDRSPPANPTQSFYDRISGAYDLIADASEHAARDQGLALLDVHSGESALVVGFGTGHALASLAHAVGPAGIVSGIDISSGMAAVARRRLEAEHVAGRVELTLGDARALPYADRRFDAGFISFTLELFDDGDIPRVLQEIRRVLRPGGRLGVVAMSQEPQVNLMTDVYVWMHRHFPHFVDCRPIPVADHLRRAGFQLERIEKLSIWSLSVAVALARKPLE